MVIMAIKSAANWRNTHTDVDRTHSFTHYINTVTTTLRSTSSEFRIEFLF